MSSSDSTVLKTPTGDLIVAHPNTGPSSLQEGVSLISSPSIAPSLINSSPPPSPDPNVNILPPGEEINIIDTEAYAIAVYHSHKDPSDYLCCFHKTLSAHLDPDVFPSEEVFT